MKLVSIPGTRIFRPFIHQLSIDIETLPSTESITMTEIISDLRINYEKMSLDRENLDGDPFAQFRVWFGEAVSAGLPEPNAMSLATVDQNAKPSVRMVLLKGFDEQGLTFFTNYKSRKGVQLENNPQAAVCFH